MTAGVDSTDVSTASLVKDKVLSFLRNPENQKNYGF